MHLSLLSCNRQMIILRIGLSKLCDFARCLFATYSLLFFVHAATTYSFGDISYADAERAKIVSGIDLRYVATNAWSSAAERTTGDMFVRAALDKVEYRVGEPIHLFLYLWHNNEQGFSLPRDSGWSRMSIEVLHRDFTPVPPTKVGEWRRSIPMGITPLSTRWFPRNRIRVDHVDLIELFSITDPGEYIVAASLEMGDLSGNSTLASGVPAPTLRFSVAEGRFSGVSTAPPSELMAIYDQQVAESKGVQRPMSDIEKELYEQNQKDFKHLVDESVAYWSAQTSTPSIKARSSRSEEPPVAYEADAPIPIVSTQISRTSSLLILIFCCLSLGAVLFWILLKKRS